MDDGNSRIRPLGVDIRDNLPDDSLGHLWESFVSQACDSLPLKAISNHAQKGQDGAAGGVCHRFLEHAWVDRLGLDLGETEHYPPPKGGMKAISQPAVSGVSPSV
jgi:hypothetical protein